MADMTDADIAAKLREAVGALNHFLHVAKHRGLFVQLTMRPEEGVAPGCLSDVCVMRPILPPTVPETSNG
jgi:hypothetical protein